MQTAEFVLMNIFAAVLGRVFWEYCASIFCTCDVVGTCRSFRSCWCCHVGNLTRQDL